MLTLDWAPARSIAQVLSVVLEESTTVFPPSNEAAKPEVPAEKTPEQKQIEDLTEALMATRKRAEDAELHILEMKRNG